MTTAFRCFAANSLKGLKQSSSSNFEHLAKSIKTEEEPKETICFTNIITAMETEDFVPTEISLKL